ncbi:DsbA family oxidoreductase [Xanthomonas hyacinthi]|uniref:DsbA family oxidoreductase n=1 Tax=Xanthomonas hyacinthi TaxID=56455 RepID=UPI000A9CBA18|nr:DsbA family oxidoreductase [Xanthomonas hyacinthi]
MIASLRIDFVSDISCTWCAIALRTLERALEQANVTKVNDMRFHPFELNPQMPPGGQNLMEHMGQKYGLNPKRVRQHFDLTKKLGDQVGFTFKLDEHSRIYNTFDAHRLLHWAGLQGQQQALKKALFHAYFSEARAPDDQELLMDLATAVGLDEVEARRILATDAYAEETRQAEQFWQRQGLPGGTGDRFQRPPYHQRCTGAGGL